MRPSKFLRRVSGDMRQRILPAIASVAVAVAVVVVIRFRSGQVDTNPEPPVRAMPTEVALQPSPALPAANRIHNLVISVNEGGTALPGALVVASLKSESSSTLSPSWTDRTEQHTDGMGQARIHARVGRWFVHVRKAGFADAFQDVVVDPRDDTISVTFSLEPGFRLSGIAVDPDGHALAPAEIKAIPLGDQLTKRRSAPEGELSVTSDVNGAFTLNGLSRGWWRLEGESEGFGRSQARVISIPTTELVELVFRPSGFIDGFVVTSDGSPAAYATVSVVGENGLISVGTSETGAFSLERAPGAYLLSARKGDLVGSTAAPTFVRARATASARITLKDRGATLRGQVTRDDGEPVTGATILVYPSLQDTPVAEVRTGNDGRWELTGFAPGAVDVEASIDGMSSAIETGFHLVDGAIVDVELTLVRLGTLEGTVVGPNGKGVAAQVVLRGKYDQFPERQVLANANGFFAFGDVPSGNVVVRASFGVEDSGSTVTARIEAGGATRLSLLLAPRYEVRVDLDRTACKELEGVTLRAFEPDASHAAVETLVSSSAQYVLLKLRAGAWTVRAVSATRSCSGQADVSLSAGVRSRSMSIRLVPAPTLLQVLVLESTEDPAPGAQVTVVTNEGLELRAETDPDGRAQLAAERAAVASISAVKRGRSARVAGTAINGNRVTLTLAPAAHLRVHIVGHQTMTRVTAVESNGESLPVEARSADPDVYLAEVPQGSLDVRASSADDSRFGASTVTTHAGETAEVTVTLKGVGFLVGTATLPPTAQGQARVAVSSRLGTLVEQLDPSGNFKLGPMPEDQYTVEVRCAGCTWTPKSVQVGSSQEARVEFQ